MTFAPGTAGAYEVTELSDQTVYGDFVVGPGKVELLLYPGETRTVDVVLTNRLGVSRTFLFHAEDVKGTRDPGQAVAFVDEEYGPYTLRDYLSTETDTVMLPHATRAVVPVTIRIPEYAEPGGRYGSLLVSTASETKATTEAAGARAGSALVSQIGVLFFVQVAGTVEPEGRLLALTLPEPGRVFSTMPTALTLLFENTGTVHLNPYGTVSVRNMIGTEVAVVDVPPWYVLPDAVRTRSVALSEGFFLGRYTASAQIVRGYDDARDEASVTFWVIPWKTLAPGVTALFVLVLVLSWLMRHVHIARRR